MRSKRIEWIRGCAAAALALGVLGCSSKASDSSGTPQAAVASARSAEKSQHGTDGASLDGSSSRTVSTPSSVDNAIVGGQTVEDLQADRPFNGGCTVEVMERSYRNADDNQLLDRMVANRATHSVNGEVLPVGVAAGVGEKLRGELQNSVEVRKKRVRREPPAWLVNNGSE